MTEPPQTDVSRPSALPTANLRIASSATQSIVDQNSAEYLEQIEEEWNKKVDVEVETLVDGMVDLVSLASVSPAQSLQLPR
jgi:mediator of RNA polymerase II transcription subunit 22